MKTWCSSNEHSGAGIPLWMNNYILIKHCLLFPTHLFSTKCEWSLLPVRFSSDTFLWSHQEVISPVMLILPPGALKDQNIYIYIYNLCRWKTFPCNWILFEQMICTGIFFLASRFSLAWSSPLIKSILQCRIGQLHLLFMPLKPGREGWEKISFAQFLA